MFTLAAYTNSTNLKNKSFMCDMLDDDWIDRDAPTPTEPEPNPDEGDWDEDPEEEDRINNDVWAPFMEFAGGYGAASAYAAGSEAEPGDDEAPREKRPSGKEVSFGRGAGACYKCECRHFEGLDDICNNCGHSYYDHS